MERTYMMYKGWFYFLFILCISFILVLPVSAKKKKHNRRQEEQLKKALTVLTYITESGSVESKAEAPALWAMLRTETAKAKLLKLLKERNHDVMARAARGLHSMGEKTGKEFLEQEISRDFKIGPDASRIEQFKLYSQYKFRKISAVEALGKIGDEVSFRMVKQLRSTTMDGQIRDACSIALAMLNEPGERIIFENAVSLKNKDPDIRRTAVQALGKIGSNASIGVLTKSLLDPDPSVRAETAITLGVIGNIRTAKILRKREYDEDVRVRREIIRALGKVLDPGNIPVINRALESDDGVLRVIAAGVIGRYGYTKGLSDIKSAMKSEDRDARIQAVESLAMIEDKRVMGMIESMIEDKDDVVRIKAAGEIIRRVLGKEN